MDRVIKNLEILASHREGPHTVLIKYLVFEHNRHEIAAARRFAEEHGFGFGAYAGVVPSVESDASLRMKERYAQEAGKHLELSAIPRRATRSCPQETKIVVDHEGRLEHCSMAWNRPHAHSVLDADIRAYLVDKVNNPSCQDCLGRGYSHYRHFGAYASPELLTLCTS